MALNRFYRPSSANYTSQFVDRPLPTDLILKQGAMKFGQQQQFYQNVGKLQALTSSLNPGYRTTELAPQVRGKYEKLIQSFTDKYSTKYDSPQALMDLQRLKSEWTNDSDVQLIKYDREVGNKEYDSMRTKSKTYHLDIDKNKDPFTGRLQQFRSGSSYTQYTPLVPWVDVSKRVSEELGKVDVTKTPTFTRQKVYDPALGEEVVMTVPGHTETRTMEDFEVPIQTLINRFRAGGEDWTEYQRHLYRSRDGGYRDPSDDELKGYFQNLAAPLVVGDATASPKIDTMRDIYGDDYTPESEREMYEMKKASIAKEYNRPNNQEIRALILPKLTTGSVTPVQSIETYKNMLYKIAAEGNPALLTGSERDQRKALKKYINEMKDDTRALKVSGLTGSERADENRELFSTSILNGKITKDIKSSSIMQGSLMFDYDSGKEINIKDRKTLFKEGTSVDVVGNIADGDYAPGPGMKVVDVGEKTVLMSGSIQEQEASRKSWNLNGWKRSPVTGIGQTFAFMFTNEGTRFVDSSMPRYSEGEPINIDGFYAKSVQDHTNDEIMIKVYAKDPRDENILDNDKQPMFIKEYKLSEYGNTDNIYDAILDERDSLINSREAVLTNFINQQ